MSEKISICSQEKLSEELEEWLKDHKEELAAYAGQYVLVGFKRGIIAAAPTEPELIKKIKKLFINNSFTEEELNEPTTIVFPTDANWGSA